MGMLDLLTPKIGNSTPAPEMEPFVAPDCSGMTDREILEAMYTEAAHARYLIEQTIKSAQSSPLLGSLVPRIA